MNISECPQVFKDAIKDSDIYYGYVDKNGLRMAVRSSVKPEYFDSVSFSTKEELHSWIMEGRQTKQTPLPAPTAIQPPDPNPSYPITTRNPRARWEHEIAIVKAMKRKERKGVVRKPSGYYSNTIKTANCDTWVLTGKDCGVMQVYSVKDAVYYCNKYDIVKVVQYCADGSKLILR